MKRVVACIAAALPLLLGGFAAFPPAATPAVAVAEAPRPNIIFIMADDVGWGDFQCYNPQGKIPSPHIDRLAREGLRFTDAHTPTALCAPTRYAVATGNYTWRGPRPEGTWSWNRGSAFSPGQKTIGHILREAGYRTGLFGKLHFGGEFETSAEGAPDFSKPLKVGPREWGFDTAHALLGGHQSPPYCFFDASNTVADGEGKSVITLSRGPQNGGIVPSEGPGVPDWDSRQVGASLVEHVLAFIDETQALPAVNGKHVPFYVHLSTDGAHGPYTPPDDLLGAPVKGRSKMTPHTDMVHEVDVVVGKIVEALEQRGLLKETLIVVTSDNGGIPTERDFGHDAVGGLRGRKSTIFEGGHRVPFVVHWGDGTAEGSTTPRGETRRQVIGTHDIVATFAELAGARPGPDQALDSMSLAAVFTGDRGDDRPVREHLLIQSSPTRDAFVDTPARIPGAVPKKAATKKAAAKKAAAKKAATRNQQAILDLPSNNMAHAIREGTWKLVFNIQDQPAALYDLSADLAEAHNLLDDPGQADRVKRLERVYREIRASRRSTPPLGGAP